MELRETDRDTDKNSRIKRKDRGGETEEQSQRPSRTAETFSIGEHITLPLCERISALIGLIKTLSAEGRGREGGRGREKRGKETGTVGRGREGVRRGEVGKGCNKVQEWTEG